MKKLILLLIPYFFIQCSKKDVPAEQYVVAHNGLYLRSEPSQKGKTIVLVPFKTRVSVIGYKGDSLELDGVSGSWCRIKWDDSEGWAFSGYLKPMVKYEDSIFLYDFIRIAIPEDVYKNRYSKADEKGILLDYGHLVNVPDLLIDNGMVVIDKNGVYMDSLSGILVKPDYLNGGHLCWFRFRSGREYKDALFLRKSYCESLSKTMPVIVKLHRINDVELADDFYRKLGSYTGEGDEFFSYGGFNLSWDPNPRPPMSEEANARVNYDLTMLDLSGGAAESYLAVLRSKKRDKDGYGEFPDCYIFMSNGKILGGCNGNIYSIFSIEKTIYIFGRYFSYNSGDNANLLFTSKEGIIRQEDYDCTFAN